MHCTLLAQSVTASLSPPRLPAHIAATVQYPPHAVSRLLSICIYTGDVDLVQRVLRSGLRADAAGVNSQASAREGRGLGWPPEGWEAFRFPPAN